ncbi:MAG: response regulator [Anaerolineae bacterium]|nr:response regulator [Anaerolineae bacterium]
MNLKVLPGGRREERAPRSNRGPGQRTHVLIVDAESDTLQELRNILRQPGWETVSATTGADALRKVRLEEPDAIVAAFTLPDMSGADFCQALRERGGSQSPPVILLGPSAGVAERVVSLRAGAADYLVKPPDARELVARLQAALALRQERVGYIIAVVGAKGGVGASTLAVNLAVALRLVSRRTVTLLDAAVSDGTADVLLNVQRNRSIGQLLARLDDLERADFEAVLTRHASGLEVLWPDDDARGLQAEELRRLILALRRMRDMVVVDAPPAFVENTVVALELADQVVLVFTPEIGAVRAARRFLNRARSARLAQERIMLVLNRAKLPGGLQMRDIESTLGVRVDVAVRDDVKLVTTSANRGVPFVQSHWRSRVGRQVAALAARLAESAGR